MATRELHYVQFAALWRRSLAFFTSTDRDEPTRKLAKLKKSKLGPSFEIQAALHMAPLAVLIYPSHDLAHTFAIRIAEKSFLSFQLISVRKSPIHSNQYIIETINCLVFCVCWKYIYALFSWQLSNPVNKINKLRSPRLPGAKLLKH